MNNKLKSGFFISFEGLDCAGKTTTINLLKKEKTLNFLIKKGYSEIVFTKEPGSLLIDFCKQMRNIILKQELKLNPITETLLFAANRSEHVEKLIKPKLENNAVVITDRYVDSSYLYQGLNNKVSLGLIESINDIVTQKIYPDLTFCFILNEEELLKRITKKSSDNKLDNIEKKYNNYKHMYNFFLKLIKNYTELGRTYYLIDASQSSKKIITIISTIITKKLCFHSKTDQTLC